MGRRLHRLRWTPVTALDAVARRWGDSLHLFPIYLSKRYGIALLIATKRT